MDYSEQINAMQSSDQMNQASASAKQNEEIERSKAKKKLLQKIIAEKQKKLGTLPFYGPGQGGNPRGFNGRPPDRNGNGGRPLGVGPKPRVPIASIEPWLKGKGQGGVDPGLSRVVQKQGERVVRMPKPKATKRYM